ncbi:MAG: ADP-dependent (S)-NAD(P)H-hydrate dehydratase [Burkholderia sp.]|jgi:ADP-dependent NAD(P)H-hydrate dehydratase|nr:ADP-dependent (S)-NAD(P)H-hydrate dehydratase [Burkholderia sp.]
MPEQKSVVVDDALLRAWKLPMPSDEGDKEERGRLLVIGGSRQMPGAVILAATAAMRAGAGKLAIATGDSVAQLVALAIPESRVIGLQETGEGGIAAAAAAALESMKGRLDAVLIGPGMQDEPAICEFVQALLPMLDGVNVVLDAAAMGVVREQEAAGGSEVGFLGRYKARVLLTPHAGEMAHLSGASKEEVADDPQGMARRMAERWQATVALKGPITYIATPDGRLWKHEGGNVGLAASGSGDTLAGIIVGLAARGAPLEQAGAWGVALHARAGDRLAERTGPLGFLTRDLAAEVPMLMHTLRG